MAATPADLSALLPAGMAGLLEQAREALDNAGTPAPEVLELAVRLEHLEEQLTELTERLGVVALSLELVADMHGRLPAAWDVLAGNVDALTGAMSGPLARIGLALAPIPRLR